MWTLTTVILEEAFLDSMSFTAGYPAGNQNPNSSKNCLRTYLLNPAVPWHGSPKF